MSQAKDGDVETRAIQLAQDDHLEWVKRPQQPGMPATPDAATNAERETYRQQARAEFEQDDRSASKP